MSEQNVGTNGFADWDAKWIAKPVADHRSWDRIAIEVHVTVESGGGSVLFGVKNADNHCGCELDAASGTIALYSLESGSRQERGRAPAPELGQVPAWVAVRIVPGEDAVRVFLDGREAIAAVIGERMPGTIGFRTGEGQSAVFRELRVFDETERALYVNRFYDPSVTQFSGGEIKTSDGLTLEENTLAVCESPIAADSPLLRKPFVLDASVAKAELRVYATGWYEASVNGVRLGDRVLAPANTPYERRMLYDTYDVTSALRTGGNAVGLWLGNGYNLNYSRWGWKWKRSKAAILQLDVELEDGTWRTIATDETWMTADSPILMNDIYDGETFDARRRQPGWDTYDFPGDGWRPAVIAEPPAEAECAPNVQPPIRTCEPLTPVRVLRPDEDSAVYDFGQNVAGWVRLQAEGPAGSRLTLRYSELVDAEGNIDPWTNRRARATDVYILNGEGEGAETYEPRFTYHGFQYVEVAAAGGAELIGIEAVPIHADVRETGRFACSDPLLNRIQSNLRWSILNNLASIPTDCCQRDERTPCLMDSAVVEEAAIHNFDMRLYYRKWLDDIADSMGNPDWSGDKVTLPWFLYWHYDDAEVLERHYGTMKAYIDHLTAKWPDGVVEDGFGDWCPPNEDGWENYFGEVAIVNTSLYARMTAVVSHAAGVLGRTGDERHYAELAERVKRAFHERFDQGNGVYGSGSQTAQLMPLALGLVPEANVPGAVRQLAAAIEAKAGHLDTGIYGTRHLLDVLADHGYIDLAYEMLTKEDYPGFGWQIAQGATTLWEQWSFRGGMHSHDHAMFGGIGTSFYTRLCGIRPAAPGYETIEIRPCVPEKLEWAEASVDTVKGRIVSKWRKEGGRLQVEVEIPEGTHAIVALPEPAGVHADAGSLERREVGPGTHRFVV